MAYEGFKDLPKITSASGVLRDKVFNIAKETKYDGYRRGITWMVYDFF